MIGHPKWKNRQSERRTEIATLYIYIYELIDWLIDLLDRCDWFKGGEHWAVNESCKQDSHGIQSFEMILNTSSGRTL